MAKSLKSAREKVKSSTGERKNLDLIFDKGVGDQKVKNMKSRLEKREKSCPKN